MSKSPPKRATDDAVKRVGVPLHTPDGRYIVVRERLWRAANPRLVPEQREELVRALMAARRAVLSASRKSDAQAILAARRAVNAAKVELGERGPVSWDDGAPDYNRRLVSNTPYAGWYARIVELAAVITRMLEDRNGSICPSDAAREYEPRRWRSTMDDVRTAAWWLEAQGRVIITQRGTRRTDPGAVKGPIRISRR